MPSRPTKGEPAPDPPRHRRQADDAYTEPAALGLVRALLDLRRETDPAGGEATERRKDDRARGALLKLGALVRELGLWAIHHHAGRRLAGLEPSNYLASGEDAAAHNAATNRHAHEWRAAAASGADYEPEAARAALADVLRMLLPREWPPTGDLVAALEAMNKGQIEPLLKPKRSRGMPPRSAELAALKERAVEHMLYRRAAGMAPREAAAFVADQYGIGEPKDPNRGKTIRDKWKNEASKSPANRSRFRAAENLGHPQEPATGDWMEDRIEAERVEVGRFLYSDEKLAEEGQRFIELSEGPPEGEA